MGTEQHANAFFYSHCLRRHRSLSLLLGRSKPHGGIDNSILNIMEALQLSRENIFQKNDNDSTPLHYVCENVVMPTWTQRAECVNIARLLIEEKADINAMDVYGWTPFHYAALTSVNPSFLLEVFGESVPVNPLSPWIPHEFAHLEKSKNGSTHYKEGYHAFVEIYKGHHLDPDFLVPRFLNTLIREAFLNSDPLLGKEELKALITRVEGKQLTTAQHPGSRRL